MHSSLERELVFFDDYEIRESAPAIVFTRPGRAELAEAANPWDIVDYSLGVDGRWGVAIEPVYNAMCLTDTDGGRAVFPEGSRRFLDSIAPAVPGHEFVGRVVAANTGSLEKLVERGIYLGSYVAGDINVGCGACEPCHEGAANIECDNGVTWVGIGTSMKAEGTGWVMQQTGRPHIPGAYVGKGGIVVLPAENVFAIPQTENPELYTITDSVGCAMRAADNLHLADYSRTYEPRTLVVGAGKLGSAYAAVILGHLPEARVFLADTNAENLNATARTWGIPEERLYLVDAKKAMHFSYSRGGIAACLGDSLGDGKFHIVADTTGNLNGSLISQMFDELIHNGGTFCTDAHKGIEGGMDMGLQARGIRNQSLVYGIGPVADFGRPIAFLTRHSDQFLRSMREISGGLSRELVALVETGGGQYKARMAGTTFYTKLG
ncbi:MAG: alcohol dehydrogenase catalytic domain-containing protein [archaeon]